MYVYFNIMPLTPLSVSAKYHANPWYSYRSHQIIFYLKTWKVLKIPRALHCFVVCWINSIMKPSILYPFRCLLPQPLFCSDLWLLAYALAHGIRGTKWKITLLLLSKTETTQIQKLWRVKWYSTGWYAELHTRVHPVQTKYQKHWGILGENTKLCWNWLEKR